MTTGREPDVRCETKGPAAVAWSIGTSHTFYEDRFRILTRDIPLVARRERGEIFAVFDGVGGAPRGMAAAQAMADALVDFYRADGDTAGTAPALVSLLQRANHAVNAWGRVIGTDRPLGACAGTIVWRRGAVATVVHAGDTCGLLLRGGHAARLTRSHEQAGTLVRYFGLGPSLPLEAARHELQDGDVLLLVSDGVTKVMHPEEAAAVAAAAGAPEDAALAVAREARRRGSPDDITALVAALDA